jgi:predicted PurR-regulated permease PerM
MTFLFKFKLDEKSKEIIKVGGILITYIFLLLNFNKVVGLFNNILNVILPFIFGFGIAYLMNPMVEFIKKIWFKIFKKDLNHKIGMIIAYVFVIAAIIVLFVVTVPEIIVSINVILKEIPTALEGLYDWLEKDLLSYVSELTKGSVSVESLLPSITSNIDTIFNSLSSNVSKVISATVSVTSFIFNLLMGVIISIYMLCHKDKYKKQAKKSLYAFFNEDTVKDIIDFCSHVHNTFSKFIVAKIIDSAIIGVLCYIGCLILGFDNALLIALVVGITNVIPYFGPFIGAIPCSLIVLLQGVNPMLIFIAFVFALQQFDGNILGPKLLGDSLGLNALWIIFSIVIMTAIFGVVGMFIGVPLFAVIYMLIKGLIQVKLEAKGKSTDTEEY